MARDALLLKDGTGACVAAWQAHTMATLSPLYHGTVCDKQYLTLNLLGAAISQYLLTGANSGAIFNSFTIFTWRAGAALSAPTT